MTRSIRTLLMTVAVLMVLAAGTARASSISVATMFRNDEFAQTGNGASLTTVGSFLSLELGSGAANDYDAVTVAFAGSPLSPVSLSQTDPSTFRYQTGFDANQAAMDADFPQTNYVFNATNSVTLAHDSATIAYSSNVYSQSTPFLTGTDYSDLQGMNAANPFTLHFSPFVTGSADASFMFLTIFDLTQNAFVYSANFLPSATTTLVLPGNTLAGGHSFLYELDYSNRVLAGRDQVGFDTRTEGTFTASAPVVPEPGTLTLVGLGVAGLVRRGRRRAAR